MSDPFPHSSKTENQLRPLLHSLHPLHAGCAKTICSGCSKCSNRRWPKLAMAETSCSGCSKCSRGRGPNRRVGYRLRCETWEPAPRPSNTTQTCPMNGPTARSPPVRWPARRLRTSGWASFLEGASIFAEQWAAQAFALGWSAEDVFGLDDIAPAAVTTKKASRGSSGREACYLARRCWRGH